MSLAAVNTFNRFLTIVHSIYEKTVHKETGIFSYKVECLLTFVTCKVSFLS
jgi:hypothetical protein